jgi:sulfate adenylyltransferase
MSARGLTILITGLSGAGKTTLATALQARIERAGRLVTLLDGDEVRRELSWGLGMSPDDRARHVMRCAWVAAQIARHGGVAICSLIAPYQDLRDQLRERCQAHGHFLCIHMSTPLATCEQRDVKGLYARARAGLISQMTGLDDPYEPPTDAALRLDTSLLDPSSCLDAAWLLVAPLLHTTETP